MFSRVSRICLRNALWPGCARMYTVPTSPSSYPSSPLPFCHTPLSLSSVCLFVCLCELACPFVASFMRRILRSPPLPSPLAPLSGYPPICSCTPNWAERNLCGNCFFKRFAFIFSTQVKWVWRPCPLPPPLSALLACLRRFACSNNSVRRNSNSNNNNHNVGGNNGNNAQGRSNFASFNYLQRYFYDIFCLSDCRLSVCLSVCVCVRSKYAMELGATPSRVLAIWLLLLLLLDIKNISP